VQRDDYARPFIAALREKSRTLVFADRVPDLVLIDEPEQHLHVSWQGAFLGALRALSPPTQFIVATHSPWVLDSVPSYERHELVTDDDPRAPRIPDAVQ
jgi:predicted ATP-binding protein involved in virulence